MCNPTSKHDEARFVAESAANHIMIHVDVMIHHFQFHLSVSVYDSSKFK
jgi:hypothetical protein